jgi:hypothetical protein
MMEGIPTIYLPPDDKESWPARLNYAFGIGAFTDGNEVEAQQRGQILAKFAESWMEATFELGPMPTEEDAKLLRSLMRDENEVELVSFADYLRAAQAPEGTREHAALSYYTGIIGYPASFHDPLIAYGLTRDLSMLTAEIFGHQLLGAVQFFPSLEETPFRHALDGSRFGQLIARSLWSQTTHIVKGGSSSQRLDDWLTVAKNGWVYLGYNHGTLPRFLHQ